MSPIPLGILDFPTAAAGAYDLLETQVLSSSASSVTFTGLDSYTDYKHLQLRMTTRTDRAAVIDTIRAGFNSFSGNYYTDHMLRGYGAAVLSSGAANQSFVIAHENTAGNSTTTGIFGSAIMDILDFSNTNKYKTIRSFSGAYIPSWTNVYLRSALIISTDALTSVTFTSGNGANLLTGCRFSIYGVKGA